MNPQGMATYVYMDGLIVGALSPTLGCRLESSARFHYYYLKFHCSLNQWKRALLSVMTLLNVFEKHVPIALKLGLNLDNHQIFIRKIEWY